MHKAKQKRGARARKHHATAAAPSTVIGSDMDADGKFDIEMDSSDDSLFDEPKAANPSIPSASGELPSVSGPITVAGTTEPVAQTPLVPAASSTPRSTTNTTTSFSGLQNGTPLPAPIVGTPGSASVALEDGVRALSLDHRVITNSTAPPMQAPAIPFPDAGIHVDLPEEFRFGTQSSNDGCN